VKCLKCNSDIQEYQSRCFNCNNLIFDNDEIATQEINNRSKISLVEPGAVKFSFGVHNIGFTTIKSIGSFLVFGYTCHVGLFYPFGTKFLLNPTLSFPWLFLVFACVFIPLMFFMSFIESSWQLIVEIFQTRVRYIEITNDTVIIPSPWLMNKKKKLPINKIKSVEWRVIPLRFSSVAIVSIKTKFSKTTISQHSMKSRQHLNDMFELLKDKIRETNH